MVRENQANIYVRKIFSFNKCDEQFNDTIISPIFMYDGDSAIEMTIPLSLLFSYTMVIQQLKLRYYYLSYFHIRW